MLIGLTDRNCRFSCVRRVCVAPVATNENQEMYRT
jgi:hypothetical protein